MCRLLAVLALCFSATAGAATPNPPPASLFAVGLAPGAVSSFPLPDGLPIGKAPAVSGSGALAFASGDSVYVVDHGRLRLIARLPDGERPSESVDSISWAPGDKSIAFAAAGPSRTVWTVRVDGRNLRRLGIGGNPQWSPDGRRIAVETQFGASGQPHAIAVINLRRRSVLTIAKTSGRTFVYGPRWSRTGDALAFTANVRGVGWVTVASGRALGSVNTLAKGSEPDWSPIDNRLVVARPTGIFVLNRHGSVQRRVGICEQLSRVLCRAPEWSRDGSRIAWLTGLGYCELRATDRRLTRGHVVAVGREMAGPLAWSRDGRTIFGTGLFVSAPPSM